MEMIKQELVPITVAIPSTSQVEQVSSLSTKLVSAIMSTVDVAKFTLVKEKLIEKGFAHLVSGLKVKRFPGVAPVVHNGWTYYYADNNTQDGVFIIAFKDDLSPNNNSINNISLRIVWQDHSPLP